MVASLRITSSRRDKKKCGDANLTICRRRPQAVNLSEMEGQKTASIGSTIGFGPARTRRPTMIVSLNAHARTIRCTHARTLHTRTHVASSARRRQRRLLEGTRRRLLHSRPVNGLVLSCGTAAFLRWRGVTGATVPREWGQEWSSCNGAKQSPVLLLSHKSIGVTVPPLRFQHFSTPLANPVIYNTGRTLRVRASMPKPIVTGGLLTEEYVFDQAEFHWGRDDHSGSEHIVDALSYAVEVGHH
ncbi:hypothetical protein HPB51_019740 [Rhipicephalus microplus]|uniref:carbonic anhydrase n=1 Tax=Rhipicephalus microplus TaxID=6941 RepID=A0A9J6F677_RHIMP|nr:hypothetical protein HPB51_019740 [Rhipicephalus microplus]